MRFSIYSLQIFLQVKKKKVMLAVEDPPGFEGPFLGFPLKQQGSEVSTASALGHFSSLLFRPTLSVKQSLHNLYSLNLDTFSFLLAELQDLGNYGSDLWMSNRREGSQCRIMAGPHKILRAHRQKSLWGIKQN